MASPTPASTSSGRNTSSSRSTWTNSRLPLLAMRASIRRRSVANSSGRFPADQRRCLVESADLLFEQRQVMQRVEDEVLALVGARMTGDHLGPAGDHHLLDIAADQEMARRVAVIAVPRAVDLFGLKCPDETLGLGIVVGLPTRLMLAAIPWASSRLVYSAQAYCTPRSEWWTRLPQGGRCAVSAMVSAATARPAPR